MFVAGQHMNKHIAFKCNWNDGTQRNDDEFPGWSGICSSPLMKLNVSGPTRRTWCSDPRCQCSKAILRGKALPQADAVPCYESALFRPDYVAFSAGGRQIHGTGAGQIAFLTSRHPSWTEDRRVVIGAFRVKEVGEHPTFPGQDAVVGVRSSVVRLKESQFLDYWALVELPEGGKPAWDSGLFRYLDDDEAAKIVSAMDAVDAETALLGAERLKSTLKAHPSTPANDNTAAEQYRDKLLADERAWFMRNARAAQAVRARAQGVCDACGSNVVEEYGADIIEAHHRQAFATLPSNTNTDPARDLAALCPSCHRALHRVSPSTSALLSVEQFAKQYARRA